MPRSWKWAVIYKDGSEYVEEENVGFGTINLAEVQTLVVFDEHNHTTQFAIALKDDMRPIFFRRRRQLQLNDPNTVPVGYVHENGELKDNYIFATVLGWQKTVNGKNVKSFIWLMHDGSVAITDRDIDDLVEA
jgi:hypothetical protein